MAFLKRRVLFRVLPRAVLPDPSVGSNSSWTIFGEPWVYLCEGVIQSSALEGVLETSGIRGARYGFTMYLNSFLPIITDRHAARPLLDSIAPRILSLVKKKNRYQKGFQDRVYTILVIGRSEMAAHYTDDP